MKAITTDLMFKSLFAKRSTPRAADKPGKTSVVLAAPASSETATPRPIPAWVWNHPSTLPWGTLHE